MANHIADAESTFVVININPDFCRVNGEIHAFDISRELPPEKMNYSPNVMARGQKVLTVGSIIKGVGGNDGDGLFSGVAKERGHTLMIEGDKKYLVNGSPVSRVGDRCLMNVKVG